MRERGCEEQRESRVIQKKRERGRGEGRKSKVFRERGCGEERESRRRCRYIHISNCKLSYSRIASYSPDTRLSVGGDQEPRYKVSTVVAMVICGTQ